MEIPINKDIRKYKVREIGPFTLREFGGFVLMGIGCYASYGLMKHFLGFYIVPLIFLAALPGIALGFINYHGIPFEKFVKTVVVENVKNPMIRPYESEIEYNIMDFLTENEPNEYIEKTAINKKCKIPPELKATLTGYK